MESNREMAREIFIQVIEECRKLLAQGQVENVALEVLARMESAAHGLAGLDR